MHTCWNYLNSAVNYSLKKKYDLAYTVTMICITIVISNWMTILEKSAFNCGKKSD